MTCHERFNAPTSRTPSLLALHRHWRVIRRRSRSCGAPRKTRRARIHCGAERKAARCSPRRDRSGPPLSLRSDPCSPSDTSRQKARVSPDQILRSYAFAVNSESGSAGAIKAASEPFDGRCPDAFFLCAGASKPGFFVEQDEASVRDSVELTYFAQVFTALASIVYAFAH